MASYRELVKRHGARLVRFAARLLRDASEAEDVVQEGFLRLWLRASEYTDQASGSAWLYRITHNLAVDRLRRQGKLESLDEQELAPVSAPQARALERKLQSTALEQALAELPARQAAALTLVHLDGMSGAEAAHVLGVSAEALESLLSRGRRGLRKRLARDLAVSREEESP